VVLLGACSGRGGDPIEEAGPEDYECGRLRERGGGEAEPDLANACRFANADQRMGGGAGGECEDGLPAFAGRGGDDQVWGEG